MRGDRGRPGRSLALSAIGGARCILAGLDANTAGLAQGMSQRLCTMTSLQALPPVPEDESANLRSCEQEAPLATLVHSDDGRLTRMKRVLCDVVQCHPVLLFTCHPHAWRDMGESMQAIGVGAA